MGEVEWGEISIGKALFVCGFPDVLVDLERLRFLVPSTSRAGTIQAIRESLKKGQNGGGIWRKKGKEKQVVVRDIGCNGLWVRWGCGPRLCEIESKEGGGEKREEGGSRW